MRNSRIIQLRCLDIQVGFGYNLFLTGKLRDLTETDIRVCFSHVTNITTIGEEREFRKVGKRFSEI